LDNKGRDSLANLGTDGKKSGMKVWNGVNKIMMGSNGGILWTWWCTFRFQKSSFEWLSSYQPINAGDIKIGFCVFPDLEDSSEFQALTCLSWRFCTKVRERVTFEICTVP